MPIYKNTKTGVVVETIAPVIGIDWVEMPTETKEVKKETPKQKPKAKKEK